MFVKKDEGFVCAHCGKTVEKLQYTSRDHCNHCLYSLHVDRTPGDRANPCKGLLCPVQIETNSKKGNRIVYVCNKCHQTIRNIVAKDDNMEEMLSIMESYAKKAKF